MQLAGGNADFGAHAELAAVGELGGGVPQHDAAVHVVEEGLRRGGILGHDAVGVVRAVAVDVVDRGGRAVHHANGNDRIQIFSVPVGWGGRNDAVVERLGRVVAA